MDNNTFLLHQFTTLREEIKATKARIFWIVTMGLFGVPIIAYLAESLKEPEFLPPMIPYLVIVLIVKFVAEHAALMRAGQYIRRNIEPKVPEALSWETWLESQPHIRMMDKLFFAMFVLVFFVYYFMAIGFAMRVLWTEAAAEPTQLGWTIAAAVTYAIGGVWAIFILLHHWRSATGTSAAE